MALFSFIFKKLPSRTFLVLVIFLGAVALAYSPSLNGQFIWDDSYLVGENPLFRSPWFILEVFRHYLYVDAPAIYYRPVQNLSYILDYWVWGDTPFGYHLTNVFLHGFSAFLLFALLRTILPGLIGNHSKLPGISSSAALLTALVWAVHPIHNAAVAYISGRADSLIALFMLSAWLAWLKSESAPALPRWLLRIVAFACCVLGFASKEAGLLWAILFLVWLFGFSEPRQGDSNEGQCSISAQKKIGALIGLLLAVLCYWYLRQLPGPRPSPDAGSGEPYLTRVLLMLRAMGDYTGLIFWPSQLHMERMLGTFGPYNDLASWVASLRGEYLSLLGLMAMGVVVWGVASRAEGRSLRRFGAAWFLIGFIPISNLLPLNAQAAEHWIYMPSIGFLLFLGGVILGLPGGQSQLAALVLLATIPLGIRTSIRSADWADSEKLFKQTARAGGGTQRIHLNLANLSTAKGSLKLGEHQLRYTLQNFPDYIPARINLGINLLKQNKEEEALKLLTFDHATAVIAAKSYAHTWSAPLNVARVQFNKGHSQEALATLQEAIGIHPGIWELIALKAQILQQTQGPAAALPEVRQYVSSRWWHLGANLMLGDLLGADHQRDAAMEVWRQAAKLDIHSAQPYVRMARFAASQNRLAEAVECQQQAIQREPDQSSNYLLLATLYDQMRKPAESEAALRRADEIRRDAAN